MVYPIENEVILLIGSDKQWCRVFQIKPLILLHQKKGTILFLTESQMQKGPSQLSTAAPHDRIPADGQTKA